MALLKNTILLLKAEKTDGEPDKYEELLAQNNFQVLQVKTLVFEYRNIGALRDNLLRPQNYSGLFLSSPRCVNAVSQALDKQDITSLWGRKFNFTVGEATYNQALDKLGIECQGKESGNAKNLAPIILQNKLEINKPFLFPHGNLKTDVLKTELSHENLELDEVLVYETSPNPEIEKELSSVTSAFNSIPEYVVFFSPSGVNASLSYLKRVPVCLSNVKFIAIGPVTETSLLKENLHVANVAKSPTPGAVLMAIKDMV